MTKEVLEVMPAGTTRVELYQATDNNWRFRVKSGNYEIIASSEGYASKANALRGFTDLVSALTRDIFITEPPAVV